MSLRFVRRLSVTALLAFTFLLAGLTTTASALQPWTKQLSTTNWMYDAHFVDRSTGWAVGQDGIFKTTNGGATWVAQTYPKSTDPWYNLYRSVFFVNANTGWAIGNRILKTTNGGATWTLQPIPRGTYYTDNTATGSYTQDYYLTDVQFLDANNGWLVGYGLAGIHDYTAPSAIFKTTNGGKSWAAVSLASLGGDRAYELSYEVMTAVKFVDANHGWVSTWYGSVLRTTNGGATWSEARVLSDLSDIDFADANNGWVVGGAGRIRRTTDGGVTWQWLDSVQIPRYSELGWSTGWYDRPLQSVDFVDAKTGYAVGYEQGTIFVTTDGGVNWTTRTTGGYDAFAGVFALDANTVWAVGGLGSSGAVWGTTVGGKFDAPTAIALTGDTRVHENQGPGWTVGRLSASDPDPGDTFTYSIVARGDGAKFAIAGDLLTTTVNFDYESKRSYSVTVRATDPAGLSCDRTFDVIVLDRNEDITLDPGVIKENVGTNAVVGRLTATDLNPGQTCTFAIVGGTDAMSFNIEGDTLRANASFNYEAKSSYVVTVRATDQLGLTRERTFTISVQDVAELPAAIGLYPSWIDENSGPDVLIGSLVVKGDPDVRSDYALSIVGGADADSFYVRDKTSLFAGTNLDHEAGDARTVRLRLTDTHNGTTAIQETDFTIAVENVNEAPTGIICSDQLIEENAGPDAIVCELSTLDPDAGQTFTYSIVGGADAASFNIVGNQLRGNASFDYATKNSYQVVVRTTDSGMGLSGGRLSHDVALTIRVTRAGDGPLTGTPDPGIGSVPGNARAPRTMYVGKAASVHGYLQIRLPAGSKPIRIYRYRYESGGWKRYGYTLATASDYRTYSRYAAPLRLPYPGTWRLRAYRPADDGSPAAWSSGFAYVKVGTRGDLAVSLAKRYVGRPYKWGAEGPRAFDSSGLTRYVFRQMNVTLPHSSGLQRYFGRRVARGSLKPGDLVFFYSPVRHVGIYIGDGRMISASSRPGEVRIEPLRKAYAGARRMW